MNKKAIQQRKTTLKWNTNGELSAIDMLRILDKISNHELNQCEITCDIEKIEKQLKFYINKYKQSI